MTELFAKVLPDQRHVIGSQEEGWVTMMQGQCTNGLAYDRQQQFRVQPETLSQHLTCSFDRDGKHAFGNFLVDRLQLLAKIFAKRYQMFHFSLRCSESGFVARRVSGGIAGLLCIAMDALDFLCGR